MATGSGRVRRSGTLIPTRPLGSIMTAIDNALHAAESEHFGLSRKSWSVVYP